MEQALAHPLGLGQGELALQALISTVGVSFVSSASGCPPDLGNGSSQTSFSSQEDAPGWFPQVLTGGSRLGGHGAARGHCAYGSIEGMESSCVEDVPDNARKWAALGSDEAGASCESAAPNERVAWMIAEADRFSAKRRKRTTSGAARTVFRHRPQRSV